MLHVILLYGFRELLPVTHWREFCRNGWHAASSRLVGFHISIIKPPASKNKRKLNDGFEPLTFKQDDVRRMTAKEQREDLLRILIAGLQRKLNLPQTTTNPQAARPRNKVADESVQPPQPPLPDRPQEICKFHSVMVIISEELLAERWFCSVSRIQRWRSQKIGPPYIKMMGRILYRVSDIEAYEQSCLVIPGKEK